MERTAGAFAHLVTLRVPPGVNILCIALSWRNYRFLHHLGCGMPATCAPIL